MNGRNPNKLEKEWIIKIVDLGCCVCRNLGYGYSPTQVHHISGSKKIDAHLQTIPLCPIHHIGGGYGVAFHAGKAVWVKKYGSELVLLEQVKILVNKGFVNYQSI